MSFRREDSEATRLLSDGWAAMPMAHGGLVRHHIQVVFAVQIEGLNVWRNSSTPKAP